MPSRFNTSEHGRKALRKAADAPFWSSGDATQLALDDAFEPWRAVNLTAQHLMLSFQVLPASARTWFCISGDRMYTASVESCSGSYGAANCGICAGSKKRKDAIHHMVLSSSPG